MAIDTAAKFQLGGVDNQHLYHNSTLALDIETGEIRWYYQHVVDHWDLDHPFERMLVDTAVAPDPGSVPWINPRLRSGEERRVMTGVPGKTARDARAECRGRYRRRDGRGHR